MLIIHWCFQLLLRSQGLFSASHVRWMSRCTRAGREHGQAANPIWPTEIFHTIDVMLSIWIAVGWGAGIHKFSRSSGSASSVSSAVAAWGQTAQSVIGQWEKLYCVSLVCIFFAVIIIGPNNIIIITIPGASISSKIDFMTSWLPRQVPNMPGNPTLCLFLRISARTV